MLCAEEGIAEVTVTWWSCLPDLYHDCCVATKQLKICIIRSENGFVSLSTTAVSTLRATEVKE